MNPFPPQAYTRDTLVKAYQWLQTQNPQMKELATTPDLLISLYVKAKSQGEDFLDRPSLKTFKSELKSLAGMMGEFETDVESPAPASAPQPPPPPTKASPPLTPPPPAPPLQTAAPSAAPVSAPAMTAVATAQLQLDPRSQLILQEVKMSLNLSSESEALRLLISMGHNRLKSL